MTRRTLSAIVLTVLITATVGRALARDGTPPADGCAVFRGEGGDALAFAGTGDAVTEPFRLEAGAAVLSVTMVEGGRLDANLYAWPAGETLYGPYMVEPGTEQDVVRVERAGDYVLDVDAAGAWSATIVQG